MPVKKNEQDTWDATCDLLGCGTFTSRGHETKKAAEARLKEHKVEHAPAEEVDDEEEED